MERLTEDKVWSMILLSTLLWKGKMISGKTHLEFIRYLSRKSSQDINYALWRRMMEKASK